jgi:hypothetical protein
VTLRARWVTLRARWVTLRCSCTLLAHEPRRMDPTPLRRGSGPFPLTALLRPCRLQASSTSSTSNSTGGGGGSFGGMPRYGAAGTYGKPSSSLPAASGDDSLRMFGAVASTSPSAHTCATPRRSSSRCWCWFVCFFRVRGSALGASSGVQSPPRGLRGGMERTGCSALSEREELVGSLGRRKRRCLRTNPAVTR